MTFRWNTHKISPSIGVNWTPYFDGDTWIIGFDLYKRQFALTVELR